MPSKVDLGKPMVGIKGLKVGTKVEQVVPGVQVGLDNEVEQDFLENHLGLMLEMNESCPKYQVECAD